MAANGVIVDVFSTAAQPPAPADDGGVIYLSPVAVALAACMLFVTAGVSMQLQLGMHTQLLVAAIRMIVQLSVLGYILVPIFAWNLPQLVLAYACFMLLVATSEAMSRPQYTYKGMFQNTLLALALSSSTMMAYVVLVVLSLQPWYTAQYFVPLLGMVLGNATSGVSVGLSTACEEMVSGKDFIEGRLALGADRWEAADKVIKKSVRLALTPLLNSMSVLGLVSIPGMMTGQILSGADPAIAARYQMVIMFVIAASSSLAAVVAVRTTVFHVLDGCHTYRADRLTRRDRTHASKGVAGALSQAVVSMASTLRQLLCCCCPGSNDDEPSHVGPVAGAASRLPASAAINNGPQDAAVKSKSAPQKIVAPTVLPGIRRVGGPGTPGSASSKGHGSSSLRTPLLQQQAEGDVEEGLPGQPYLSPDPSGSQAASFANALVGRAPPRASAATSAVNIPASAQTTATLPQAAPAHVFAAVLPTPALNADPIPLPAFQPPAPAVASIAAAVAAAAPGRKSVDHSPSTVVTPFAALHGGLHSTHTGSGSTSNGASSGTGAVAQHQPQAATQTSSAVPSAPGLPDLLNLSSFGSMNPASSGTAAEHDVIGTAIGDIAAAAVGGASTSASKAKSATASASETSAGLQGHLVEATAPVKPVTAATVAPPAPLATPSSLSADSAPSKAAQLPPTPAQERETAPVAPSSPPALTGVPPVNSGERNNAGKPSNAAAAKSTASQQPTAAKPSASSSADSASAAMPKPAEASSSTATPAPASSAPTGSVGKGTPAARAVAASSAEPVTAQKASSAAAATTPAQETDAAAARSTTAGEATTGAVVTTKLASQSATSSPVVPAPPKQKPSTASTGPSASAQPADAPSQPTAAQQTSSGAGAAASGSQGEPAGKLPPAAEKSHGKKKKGHRKAAH